MLQTDICWDLPNPFCMDIEVQAIHMDRLGHTNNAHYLNWMEEVSWPHIESVGMGWEVQEASGKSMAIVRTEIDYIASSYAGDALIMGTWITTSDNKFQSSRQFQLVRRDNGKTLLRAVCKYVCIDLKKGKPGRMPPEFAAAHQRALHACGKSPSGGLKQD